MTKISFENLKTKELVGHKQKVHTLSWDNIGRKLASGSVDKTIRIWTPEISTDVKSSTELKGHESSVNQLVFDPNSVELLASASSDKTVKLWDVRAGKCIQTYKTNDENINICYSPDSKYIAVGDKNDTINFINLESNQIEKTINYDTEINEFCFNHLGNALFLSTGQGSVKIVEFSSLQILHSITAHGSNCYCLEIDPQGKYLATGGGDSLVTLWDLQELICVKTFDKLEWPIRTLSFSYDGNYLAFASENLMIDIRDIVTSENVHTINCNASMNAISWHPNKYLLCYAGDEIDQKTGEMAGNLRIFGL